MLLITPAYHEKNDLRRAELREALVRNLRSGLFERIILVADSVPDYLPVSKAIAVHRVAARPTYQVMFGLAGPGPTVVANSDIYFDETLLRLKTYDLRGKLLCVSRREVGRFGKPGKIHNPWRSQDAWIFHAPLPPLLCNFPLGVLGCDQRLAHEAQVAGLGVTNPCLSIQAWHLHASGIRRYSKHRLPGRYARLAPCIL